ncbi:M23 family metallopeptidase [Leptothoe kymatousa]|uniref:Peptidoglycan DD-metalloendopeptidase family protein n=1 Tax=Leptothoe kymatousa TAU-MAC 1615 TaxID=2364775 RepID=A0ABS5Y6I4_9CYAN|nr:M23 family metallopeptidase [Leptothoe kymatousa]MBT9313216.1 peptidoglycan DD-metalloendopeptidase family protein [Leptothoe kymatousa TAU-MAC 1615]
MKQPKISPIVSSRLQRRAFLAMTGAMLGTVASGSLWSPAAHAYDVTLSPTNPRLGDTISVMISGAAATGTPPVVSVNGTDYPSFPVSGNRYRALVPTSPLDSPGRLTLNVSAAGSSRSLAVNLGGRSFSTQRIWLPEGSSDLGTDHEFDRVAEFKRIVTPERRWQGPLVRPSQGYVSTVFGVRRYYNGVFAEDYYHRGVDYAAATGAPVVSPAAGTIRLVGRVADGFEIHGNTIGIDHGQGVLSIMIHLSRIDVAEGDVVNAGQVIGGVGSTGASTGPHLHWGLYVHGVAVDPVPWRFEGVE